MDKIFVKTQKISLLDHFVDFLGPPMIQLWDHVLQTIGQTDKQSRIHSTLSKRKSVQKAKQKSRNK